MFILSLRGGCDWLTVALFLVLDLVAVAIMLRSIYKFGRAPIRPNYAFDNVYNIVKTPIDGQAIARRQDANLNRLATSHKVKALDKALDKGNNFNRLYKGM